MEKMIKLALCLVFLSSSARAQMAFMLPTQDARDRPSFRIEVSHNKTTHLIFPYEIKYADLGSRDIAGESVEKAANVFRLKALDSSEFQETNLTVVTADGRLFSFLVHYNENPEVLTYDLTQVSIEDQVSKAAKVSSGSGARLADHLNHQSELAMQSRRRIRHIGHKSQGINLSLKNLLYDEDVMYLVLGMENSSKLDYLHTYITQLKVAGESSATQDVAIEPIKVFDASENLIPRHEGIVKVIAIERLTLERDRRLIIQMGEESGGRQVSIAISSEELITARPL
jgi:conjugative transposon TraN protein